MCNCDALRSKGFSWWQQRLPHALSASFRRAELGVDRANLDLKGSVLVIVRNVEAAYYNLVFARQQRGVRQLSLELAQQLLEANRARRQTGVATDLDVLQAEFGVAA